MADDATTPSAATSSTVDRDDEQVLATESLPAQNEPAPERTPLSDLVEQPAKVMRIGGMIRQLLEEVKAAPLDEASRARLRDIYEQSIHELKDGLAPELVSELERLSLPFDSASPSEAELRVAKAQLVGWLEGLFHGIQAALYAQQVQAQSQLSSMRLALPGNAADAGQNAGSGDTAHEAEPERGARGMYL